MKQSFHRVFFVSNDDFVSPDRARINPSDSFHIVQVLRMNAGEKVLVSTMKGKYEAEILDANAKAVLIGIGRCLEALKEDLPYIVLIQAIPKLKKMDEIIEKATEFGVNEVIPVISSRSQLSLNAPSLKGKEERWKRVAVAASKQSRRQRPTLIHPPQYLDVWANSIDHNDQMVKILLWELEDKRSLIHMIPQLKKQIKVALCVGPEGGFTIQEVQSLTQIGFVSCSLGQQILKTETAGPFAVGFLKFALEGEQ